ncbi:1196_t:CDS:2, partial [Gigaspora margarita]
LQSIDKQNSKSSKDLENKVRKKAFLEAKYERKASYVEEPIQKLKKGCNKKIETETSNYYKNIVDKDEHYNYKICNNTK